MKFFPLRFLIALCVCAGVAANAIGQVSPLDPKYSVSTREELIGPIVTVDTLILGGMVVTMNGERRVIENGAIAIKADKIGGVGTRADITKQYSATRKNNAAGKVIIPGLINTHTHIP